MHRALPGLLLTLVVLAPAHASWPSFRGPHQDGALPGVRLLEGPAPALAVAWSVELGSGYSAPVVADGRVVTTFAGADGDYVAAFDAGSGEKLWSHRISDPYKGHDGSHDGPISTPAIDGGRVFGLGAWGHLVALEAATGKEIWTRHLVDDLGADKPWYGFASSLRVVDGVLAVELSQAPPPENEDGAEPPADAPPPKPRQPMAIAGLDAATGATLWVVGDDHVEYHSSTLATFGGRRQLVAAGKTNLYGLDPRTGEILWTHRHDGDDRAMGGMTIVPLPAGEDRVFLMNKIDASVMLQVRHGADGWNVSELWSAGSIARSYVPPVYHGGHLYGMNNRIFTCVDAATGETVWRSREPGDGFPIVVGDHLVVMTKPGTLHVVDATPEAYREVARLDLFEDLSWSETAFAEGSLFARSMGRLARIDVTSERTTVAAAPAWFEESVLGRFLAELGAATDKAAAVDAFLARHPQSPIVEDDGTVHFVYRGAATDVGIVGDLVGFRREDPLTRAPGTDLFHYSTRLEPNAASTYGFIVDYGDPAPDPRNPRNASGLFGDVSWFAMPAWAGPALAPEVAADRRGRLVPLEWTSAALGDQPRKARVYLPAGYDGDDRRYPVAYVHFGDQALEHGMQDALDRLIGTRIEPLIAVFIHADEEDPRKDARDERYRAMVKDELVPRIDADYRTLAAPKARASIGFGHIANTAIRLGFDHPDVFGRVAGQSPLMGAEELPDLAERGADVRPLVIYLDWGTYHMRSPHEAWSLTESCRELWTALREAGYRPAGGEYPEGFGWPMWSARTDAVLAALFPRIP